MACSREIFNFYLMSQLMAKPLMMFCGTLVGNTALRYSEKLGVQKECALTCLLVMLWHLAD
jgi:hypothetical protein